MKVKDALFNYCLRMGDSGLILGQRLAEWISKGPTLEEDIALTNISLDQIGQARSMYAYAAKIEGLGRTEDDIAYLRDERSYFNFLLAELPNGNFADTMARQLFIDVFNYHFYQKLAESSDERFAAHGAKSLKEVTYHLRHSGEWVVRLGDGTEESHQKIQKAIDDKWMFTGDLFEMNAYDELLIDLQIGVDLEQIRPLWQKMVAEILERATLTLPPDGYMQTGRMKGIHTEHLGHLLSDLQYMQRTYPDSKW